MEKILLAVDATKINMNTLDFACYIAGLSHSRLTGIFLENVQERSLAAAQTYSNGFNGLAVSDCDENIRIFRETCAKLNTGCNIHRDRGVPVNEIINETRFADILILDPNTSFLAQHENAPTDFAKKVLASAECPVIIAPETFKNIEDILFMYDGSDSSVFAIKQFTHLFPGLDEKKVTLLQVHEDNNNTVEDRQKIAEWLKSHFSVINIMTLNGKIKNSLSSYLAGRKDLVIVMGAYGRSTLSQFFKSSSADPIIRTVNLPVFIAHR